MTETKVSETRILPLMMEKVMLFETLVFLG